MAFMWKIPLMLIFGQVIKIPCLFMQTSQICKYYTSVDTQKKQWEKAELTIRIHATSSPRKKRNRNISLFFKSRKSFGKTAYKELHHADSKKAAGRSKKFVNKKVLFSLCKHQLRNQNLTRRLVDLSFKAFSLIKDINIHTLPTKVFVSLYARVAKKNKMMN